MTVVVLASLRSSVRYYVAASWELEAAEEWARRMSTTEVPTPLMNDELADELEVLGALPITEISAFVLGEVEIPGPAS